MKELIRFDGKVIGWINSEEGVYISKKSVDSKSNVDNGRFIMDVVVLNMLQKRNIKLVRVISNGLVYQTTTERFFSAGIPKKDSKYSKLMVFMQDLENIGEAERQSMLNL